VHATDGWIATIATIQTAVLVVGYFFWTFESRRRGSRFVLLMTTSGLSLYPLVTAFTTLPWVIAIIAGFAGIFQAGVDLVLFDELMKTIPSSSSSLFVSVAQTISYLAAIISPLLGTYLAGFIGYANVLIISGIFLFIGFVLFAIPSKNQLSKVS
jgi:MFS family permease